MKISKLILFIGLITLIGLVPLVSKSQTGSLEVCVHCINGDVVEGAIINIEDIYSDTTGADGCVNFAELMVGEWEVQCLIEGYPPNSTIVYIEEDILTLCNFDIYCPQFVVEPLEVEVLLEPNEQSNEIITLSNPGLADVEWTAELEIFPPGNLNWISIDTTSGILTAGETTEVFLYFDAQGVLPWDYHAEIQFYTLPDIGTPKVDIVMNIEGQPGLGYLESEINCTNNILNWETFPPGIPTDSFHVYRDSLWYATVFATTFIDSLVYPEIEHAYFATGYFYLGWESWPTNTVNVIVPALDSLEPLNLENMAYYPDGYDITLWWEEPNACIAPDGYNVYRNGYLIAEMITELTFIDPDITWMYELVGYNVTAVYYFGESEFSNTTYFLNSEIENFRFVDLFLFPNPVKDKLNIQLQSPYKIIQIELLNNLGLSIFNKKVNSSSYQLNVSDLSPGIYFVKLDIDQGMVTRKILIE